MIRTAPLHRWLSAPLLAAALLGAGCATTAPPPEVAVTAWAEAVQRRDADAAWDLLDEEARQGMTRESFEVLFEHHHPALLQQAELLLTRAEEVTPRITAEVPLPSQRAVTLQWSDAQWRLASTTPAGLQQDTPRAALASFAAALDRRDLDALITLMSEERRVALVGEFSLLRQQIEAHLDRDLVVRGDRAVLKLSTGDRVLLVRKDGQWRVDGLEKQP